MSATIKRKPRAKGTTRRRISRAEKPSNGKAKKQEKPKTAGQGDFATEQKPLIEDADERIPELDDACQRVLQYRDARKKAKSDEDQSLEEVGKLIHKHDLNCYMLNGKKFCIEPGAESVKVVNVKQNG